MRKLLNTIKHNFYLYGLYCPVTDKLRYIGITTGTLNSRLNFHLRKPTNPKISMWFESLKNNNTMPSIKLIKECNDYDELLKSEINEIKKHRELGHNLFNVSDGGDINPMYGNTHTEEARKKISLTHKGTKKTEAQKENQRKLLKELWTNEVWATKVRNTMIGNKNSLGHKHSEYSKNLIREIRIKNNYIYNGLTSFAGHKHTEESKRIMSINNSGINNPMYGKRLSDESLRKRSEKVIKEGTYKGQNNPNFKFNIEKNSLIYLYLVKNMTINEISNIYGCCEGVIKNRIKKFQIKKPMSNKYNLKINEINVYLKNGLNLIEIGKNYGCSNKIISKFIKCHKNG